MSPVGRSGRRGPFRPRMVVKGDAAGEQRADDRWRDVR